MKVMQMAANVIDDNNTSQPIAASDVYKRQVLEKCFWGRGKVLEFFATKSVETLLALLYRRMTIS